MKMKAIFSPLRDQSLQGHRDFVNKLWQQKRSNEFYKLISAHCPDIQIDYHALWRSSTSTSVIHIPGSKSEWVFSLSILVLV